MSVVSIERLRAVLEYDPATGDLTWKNRPESKRFSARQAGTAAGAVGSNGYVKVQIDSRCYLAHRLIWALVTGEWPAAQIDHINNTRNDNRWINLRAATGRQNQGNRLPTKGNPMPKGVSYHKKANVYFARIRRGKTLHHLGSFRTAALAADAYRVAADQRWGEFAKVC